VCLTNYFFWTAPTIERSCRSEPAPVAARRARGGPRHWRTTEEMNRTADYFPGSWLNFRKHLSPSLIGEQASHDSAELLTGTANNPSSAPMPQQAAGGAQ
jgi:hypothetical protein